MRMSALSSMLFLVVFASASLTGQAKESPDPLANELVGQLASVGDKWVKLLEATPDDKLDWRPAKGVRSIRELYTHIGDANYFFLTFLGIKLPEGPQLPKDQADRENRFKTKDEILKNLKASYDFSRAEVSKLTGKDFEKEVNMFGTKTSARNSTMTNLGHQHEHLGQAIAYARMIGYVPPWSKGE